MGPNDQMLPGDGVSEFQRLGTQHLTFQTEPTGLISILGIAQNGMTHMGTMEAQLVGASGDGTEGEFAYYLF